MLDLGECNSVRDAARIMNRIYPKMAQLACCLASAMIFGCGKSTGSENLGSIKLTSAGTSSLALQISKTHAQPFGLQFESPDIEITEIEKMSSEDSLEVFLENNDALPMTIYLNSKKSNVEILPKSSERIFSGSFKDLLLMGRMEYKDLTIESTTDRKVNATLKFVRLSGSDALTINVRSWRIQFGP
jgi:hypothetical protein